MFPAFSLAMHFFFFWGYFFLSQNIQILTIVNRLFWQKTENISSSPYKHKSYKNIQASRIYTADTQSFGKTVA